MDAICQIARRHNLKIIEDSCEALGAAYKGRPAGMLGDVGLFAFYPNKQMTTGEGGVLVTDDDHVAAMARSMRNQGRDPTSGWLGHPRLGYNYRMPDILAALGTSQLARIDELVAKRAKVAEMYLKRLADEKRISTQKIEPHVEMSWFVFVVKLADTYEAQGPRPDHGASCASGGSAATTTSPRSTSSRSTPRSSASSGATSR